MSSAIHFGSVESGSVRIYTYLHIISSLLVGNRVCPKPLLLWKWIQCINGLLFRSLGLLSHLLENNKTLSMSQYFVDHTF